MATKQDRLPSAEKLADLLKAERTRHGVCESSLTSIIKVQKRYIASLNKQIVDLRDAYIAAVAVQLKGRK